MATAPEEIERQHQEALKFILQQEKFKQKSLSDDNEQEPPRVLLHENEISLEFKKCPSCQLYNENINEVPDSNCGGGGIDDDGGGSFPVWSLRGRVDVQKLQGLFREGYNDVDADDDDIAASNGTSTTTKADADEKKNQQAARKKRFTAEDVKSVTNLWDEANAAVNNVRICRPSHDAWGIKKVAFIFSDDFLLSTYEMPWWHGRPDIRQAMQPVFNVLGIKDPATQLVRLLLASLPPGVTIPVHHDTGEWVKTTHRVHVPILVRDPSRVLFRAGINNDQLQRIDCTPGLVFELNNQCRHTVSNCDSDHRVHLILDYIENASSSPPPQLPQPHIRLNPAEVVFQTRRSISRLADKGRRQTPSFLILGAQKAGTTSLYEYVNQHPLIVRARRRETHCLDWRWNDQCKTVKQQRDWCRKFYYADELDRHPSLLTGESTPSYLLDSRRVLPRAKRVLDWSDFKFLVVLRDPIQRAESHYAMVTSTQGTVAQLQARGSEWRGKSIGQVIREELLLMNDACGLIPYFDIETGLVDEAIWDEFSGSKEEDEAWDRYLSHIPLNTGSHCLLGRGLYELNLRPWFQAFGSDRFLVLELQALKQDGGVDKVMQRVWRHLNVPAVEISDDAPKNQREYTSSLSDDLKEYVKGFYEPHNRRLETLLGKEWRDIWTTTTVT